ncbi:hypothetical protein [Acinetobacter sp.]|uniref:hypothetical protein n=1 Tax=Acinetobacter sp. TaxID=472 RepID=UPI00388F60CE
MLINELFKKKVEITNRTNDEGKSYEFTVNGKTYVCEFFEGPRSGEFGLEFHFVLKGAKTSNGKDNEVGITGTGDELEVFSGVMQVLKTYMNVRWHRLFHFAAKLEEPSRVKLYDRMVKRLKKEFPKWECEIVTGNLFQTYIFERVEYEDFDDDDDDD